MQILPDLFMMNGVSGAHCFLLTTVEGLIVVDTGMPGQMEKVLANIQALGKKPEDVKLIVLTHADLDHSGSAAALRARTGAPIAAHELDALALAGKRPGKKVRGPIRLVFAVLGLLLPPMPLFSADRYLMEGDSVGTWRVLFTPGHTEGSISLYLDGEALIPGDALRCDRAGIPILPSAPLTNDMAVAMQSLARIAKLKFSIVLPGHGAPCLEKASEKIGTLIPKSL
jgi:hydroxyacylglutathione hydrolase